MLIGGWLEARSKHCFLSLGTTQPADLNRFAGVCPINSPPLEAQKNIGASAKLGGLTAPITMADFQTCLRRLRFSLL